CLSAVEVSEQVPYLVGHRVAKPLEGFIVLTPAWPEGGVDRDRALLHFSPHLDNGIRWFGTRDGFVVGVGQLMGAGHDRRSPQAGTPCQYRSASFNESATGFVVGSRAGLL